MVYNVVFWLNNFPHKDGVHTKKPFNITGLSIDYNNNIKVELLEKQSKECC